MIATVTALRPLIESRRAATEAEHVYVRPSVRALASPTAHPSTEVWPGAVTPEPAGTGARRIPAARDLQSGRRAPMV